MALGAQVTVVAGEFEVLEAEDFATEDDTVGHRSHLRPPRPKHPIEEGASVLRARLENRCTPRLDHGIE